MRTRKSKKEKQYYVYYGYNKKDKRTNNDLQNITQKTKDRVTRIPLRVMLDQIIYNKIYHNTAV
jgi:hypothetical protein